MSIHSDTADLQAFMTSAEVPARLASSATAHGCLSVPSLAVRLLLLSVWGRVS